MATYDVPGERVILSQIPTEPPKEIIKEKINLKTQNLVNRIGELQLALYAEKKHSILVILQGMDASGKDSTVKEVFASCNHLGVQAYAFKKPTEEEASHDFLWRAHNRTPEKGAIAIFVRSYYEEMLIQRVHRLISDKKAENRMAEINAFERLLQSDNDTVVLKFYLHISRKEQRKQLQDRIDDETKQWKHDPNDWKEAQLWDEYMSSYEYIINNSIIPWNIVPVDKRWYKDYMIAAIVCDGLERLNPKLPTFRNGVLR